MTKKHFALVARIFAARVRFSRSVPLTENELRVLTGLAMDFASAFAEENPRFNRARFLSACGLEGGK
jgi:hypothetical protein